MKRSKNLKPNEHIRLGDVVILSRVVEHTTVKPAFTWRGDQTTFAGLVRLYSPKETLATAETEKTSPKRTLGKGEQQEFVHCQSFMSPVHVFNRTNLSMETRALASVTGQARGKVRRYLQWQTIQFVRVLQAHVWPKP